MIAIVFFISYKFITNSSKLQHFSEKTLNYLAVLLLQPDETWKQ